VKVVSVVLELGWDNLYIFAIEEKAQKERTVQSENNIKSYIF
jgi:hypothetical protein